ncbi:MAG: hypothetical protein NC043_02595 [Muribaculaceae bacterium]|nr:hypothetical protein [Muribaculaceae bacterium]
MNHESIIGLKYDGVQRHPRMSMEARAAQFAPFAALTGHSEAIAETARIISSQFEPPTREQDKSGGGR